MIDGKQDIPYGCWHLEPDRSGVGLVYEPVVKEEMVLWLWWLMHADVVGPSGTGLNPLRCQQEFFMFPHHAQVWPRRHINGQHVHLV